MFSGSVNPANTRYLVNVGLMLAQCRRQWANIIAALAQRLMVASLLHMHKYTATKPYYSSIFHKHEKRKCGPISDKTKSNENRFIVK